MKLLGGLAAGSCTYVRLPPLVVRVADWASGWEPGRDDIGPIGHFGLKKGHC